MEGGMRGGGRDEGGCGKGGWTEGRVVRGD